MPNAAVTAVVEPWFLGAGADSPPGKAFAEWAEAMKEKGVAFCDSVDAVPVSEGERTLALISGRTADNPRLHRVTGAGAVLQVQCQRVSHGPR